MSVLTPAEKNLIQAALSEDLSDKGDITSQAIFKNGDEVTAVICARENGILAGLDIAKEVFHLVDPALTLTTEQKDGNQIEQNQTILTIQGKTISILKAERTALNFLSHLSGVASETKKYVEILSHTKAKILDTRKTLPGWRALQKQAVLLGGGQNHRLGLYDMALIKDNHIAAAGSIGKALDRVQSLRKNTKIEIEVDTLDQLDEVLSHGGADIVLLDNMSPQQLSKAVQKIDGKMLSEASGGITLSNLKEIAESGVDFISIGALTHSVRALDFGLDIQ
ncbi:MAG: carboxylating nicotinate-nucleotide diphosphorylase, partial [Alphaproteobacteria bacterium]|nr:carboxylating nicotinate-nucleotide diphosphorylase [Alphaproteobacteria bacterium]